jgi:His/Glu/Gln/Arg/opine family amino acid ABC transporter permease subunit
MSQLHDFSGQLASGAVTTLEIAVASVILGIGIGLCGAIAKDSGSIALRGLISLYTTTIRGIPELLIILVLYFGGTAALTAFSGRHVEVNAFASGVFALTLVFGAYAIEVFRAAIRAVPCGQMEAARALGLPEFLIWRFVILPQMWRHVLPGLGNLWLTLLKDTALVSVVGLDDLMRKTTIAAGATHDPLTFYCAAASVYLLFTSVSIVGLAQLERRSSRGVRFAT